MRENLLLNGVTFTGFNNNGDIRGTKANIARAIQIILMFNLV